MSACSSASRSLSFSSRVTEQRDTERARRDIESAGAEISRASGSLESVIYREQQLRDEQERARYRHEVQERAARVRSGPSMEM